MDMCISGENTQVLSFLDRVFATHRCGSVGSTDHIGQSVGLGIRVLEGSII